MVTPAAFWDKVAEKYDRKTVKGPNYRARIERAAKWIGPDKRVLDAGCAGGQITLDLAPHVAHITGIDLSPKLIGYAQQRCREQGVQNAEFRVATPEDPFLEPGSFDAITAYSLLHLVEDESSMLRRLHDLLKPGGTLIAEVPCRENIGLHFRLLIRLMTMIGKAPKVCLYSLAEHQTMFSEAGFRVQEAQIYNPKSLSTSILAVRKA
ncbi:MAG: class I SAM-dependent methyltransferase [Phycisphaeraceae bacterium]